MSYVLLQHRRVPFVSVFLLLVAAGSAASCGGDADRSGPAPHERKAALPATFALASEPAGAKPVKEVVASAKSGDEVVITGRVGEEGKERAFFKLVDPSLKSCTDLGDECKTPWDFCCTSSEEMATVSATVLFEADGKPIAGSVLGFQGLDHLTPVVVKGRAEKDAAGNLTVVASGIFVRK